MRFAPRYPTYNTLFSFEKNVVHSPHHMVPITVLDPIFGKKKSLAPHYKKDLYTELGHLQPINDMILSLRDMVGHRDYVTVSANQVQKMRFRIRKYDLYYHLCSNAHSFFSCRVELPFYRVHLCTHVIIPLANIVRSCSRKGQGKDTMVGQWVM